MNSGTKLLQDFFNGLVNDTFAQTIGLSDLDLTEEPDLRFLVPSLLVPPSEKKWIKRP